MYWREFLCALLLLGFLAGGRSEPQYVLSSPVALISGETGKACVNIVGNKEKLDVQLILQHDGQNTTIIGEDVSAPIYYQCGEYKIPNVANAVAVTLTLSAIGDNTKILDRKTVVIKPNKINCIFQMDKPIYKPGQKVMCRIVCLNSQFKPVNEQFTSTYLQDPSNTRIKQWPNQEMQHGVMSVEFQLIKDAPPGYYRIRAERKSSHSLSQGFTVEEYVPPRFSMKLEAPNTISVLDDDIKFKVSSLYTYGEAVAGIVTVIYCKQPSFYGRRKNCFKEKGDLCFNMTGKLDHDGTFSSVIDMSKVSGGSIGSTGMSMRIDATVTEEGTGIQVSDSSHVWATTQPARLSLDYEAMPRYYKRGLDYNLVGRLMDEKDNPMPNEEVEIEIDNTHIQTVRTNSDGKIEHKIDTSDMIAPNFTMRLSYKNNDQCYYADWRDTDYPSTEFTAYRFYSKSGSYLQANPINGELNCGQNLNIDVQYTMSRDGVGEEATASKIYYLVMSKSKIVYNGQQDVDLSNSRNGSITIALPISADMAPNANLVVYSILKEELIVETVSMNIEKCFKNNVDMAFSEEKGSPGSTVDVILSAAPESFCGLRVIDSSLLLLNRYERFTADGVHGLFSYWSYGYNIDGLDVEDPEPQCVDPNKLVFYNGNYYLPVSSISEGDSYQNLKEIGLILGTRAQVRKPKVCDNDNNPPEFRQPIALESATASLKAADAGFGGARSSAIETVRTNFSETMMWYMVFLNKDGHASLSEIVPDTITKWEGTAFCMSEEGGFGITKYPANYTTMLPFFLELSKPSFIIRGETLLLSGTAHNYMDHCVKVEVTLDQSDAFTAELKEEPANTCICSKERATYIWEMKAHSLGEKSFTAAAQTTFIGKSCDGPNDDTLPPRKDTVVQSILVLPEGIPQERTLSNLVFVKPGTPLKLPVSITPPNNIVPDSISAYVAGVGDVVGLPLNYLNNLVQKPYGCAEQSLSQMASTISVLDYLNATHQLNDDTLKKGQQYILEGYYRQLGYASGGAYKVFRSAETLNSWLSVYCFNTFEKAKKYIQIDENRQQQTLIWLENTQRLDNGCFKPQGNSFTFQDTDNNIQYTAHLAIALLESQYSLGKTLLNGAMECLKNASTTEQKIGNQVLMLYAFSLADLPEYRNPLLAKLMAKAKVKDGTIYWERENMPARRPVPFFLPIYAPAEVHLGAYMLLSLIEGINKAGKTKVSEKDMTTMAQMSLWLTRQQNGHGGFPSTSDTVVGIKALSAYAKMLFTPNSQHSITIKKNDENVGVLNLNSENRLVVQRQDLPDASGDYSLEVEGNGWFLTQTTVKFYTQIPEENSAYQLAMSTTSDTCLNGVARTFNISISISYHGFQNNSGMTIIITRMLSGYHPDTWSLRELENQKIVSKAVENSKGEVEIYLDSVNQETQTFSFRVFMGERVLNVKSSSCIAYDYYEQDENGYASYQHPCAKHQ